MFLRHITVKKKGKTYTYWRLVEAIWVGGQQQQRIVANLGALDAEDRAKARQLARRLTGRAEQYDLFERPSRQGTPMTVDVDGLRIERGRSFGGVWLGWLLWRTVELDRFCAAHLGCGREKVAWSTMASILVIARLCEPSSELHIAQNWYRRTALEDLLGVPSALVNDDRLYRTLDRLLPHKQALEEHLKERLGKLFDLDYEILLYDVTSTYFEGQAEANPKACRGHSRDHRGDCKQVCIGLVVTRQGIPLGYEVFAGNRVDVTTVEDIVETMEKRYGRSQRVWVMDRGMSSEANIAWLQAGARRYLLGASRAELRKLAPQLADQRDWRQVRDGVEAKLCDGPTQQERFVLVRSVDRQAKEQAMHARFCQRIEQGLESLQRRLDSARNPIDRSATERQIGRLLGRNSRAAGRYTIDLLEAPDRPAGVRLHWSIRPQWDEWSRLSEGAYVLRTNITTWSDQELWQTYIQLNDAEAAFRINKSDLSIRPIWHQLEHRVDAHILVCFLAYVMWKTLELWQQRAGLGNSPRTILDEIGRIQSADVVLPIHNQDRQLRLRCVIRPDDAQAALIDRLGLTLPERLRITELPAKNW